MAEMKDTKTRVDGMHAFEEHVRAATRRGTDQTPACILRALDSSGSEVYANHFGYNGIAPDAPPVEPDATLWIASFTKIITAICCLQLHEQGLVDFDEPVGSTLPELERPDIVLLDDSSGSNPGFKLVPAANKITLRHLLTHTSGLPYEFTGQFPQVALWRKAHPEVPCEAGSVTRLYNCPLVFEPGTSWAYGSGSDWAGQLVERLNPEGLTLGEYVRAHVFGRLGAGAGSDTTFRLDSAQARAARIEERWLRCVRRASAGEGEGDAAFVPHGNMLPNHVSQDSGGGGLFSSVPDFTAVLADLISPAPRLLRPDTVERYLFSPCMPLDQPDALRSLAREKTGMTPGADVAECGVDYSMGGMLWTRNGRVLPAATLTWGGLPNLKWMANRARGLCAVYASQVMPPGDPPSQALAARFFQELWANFG